MLPPSSIGWRRSSPLLLLCQAYFGSQQFQSSAQLFDPLDIPARLELVTEDMLAAYVKIANGAAQRALLDDYNRSK